MGVDAIAPNLLVALPSAGMEELVQIYQGVEQALALPQSTLSQWMVALQKPDGGERLIVLQAMTIRVYVRARRADLEAWSSSKAAFWDSAVRGSSPL